MLVVAAIAVTAVMLAVVPAAAADDELLAPLPANAAQGLGAYGGHVVWSQQVAERRHVLMRWHQGQVDPLPAEWIAPLNVNVGSDARGRPVAVYSRCLGDWAFFRTYEDCAVYMLPLLGGGERRITRISDRTGSEFAPAIWRGNIAYASWRSARALVTVRLLARGARRETVLARLSRERLGQSPDPNDAAFGFGGMDLTSNAVVFAWSAGAFSELRRVSVSTRRSTLLARGFIQEGLYVSNRSPNATPRQTMWIRESGSPGPETRIVMQRGNERQSTPPIAGHVRALARDGNDLYAITGAPGACFGTSDLSLVRLAPLTFTPEVEPRLEPIPLPLCP